MHEATLRSLRPTNAFDHMHEASLRELRNNHAFNFHEELYSAKTLGLFDSTMASSLRRHIDGLNESIAVRVLRDPFLNNLRESPFLAAQSQMEQTLGRQLTDLVTGFSARSASLISRNF